jgi:hypothetical protein
LPGQLFSGIAQTLTERRDAKRGSLQERVKVAADLVNSHEPARHRLVSLERRKQGAGRCNP